jgi:hypothetical protein
MLDGSTIHPSVSFLDGLTGSSSQAWGPTKSGSFGAPNMIGSPWSWAPALRMQCLRCTRWFTTRELAARCPYCGFTETVS